VLFGDYNPAGRLPVTFYKSIEDLPPFDDYNMSGRTYRYFKGEPQFEFGYGLSYTQFGYSDLKTEKRADTLFVEFELTNAGERDGQEVVQLYVKEKNNREKVPLKSLKSFQRVFLKAGGQKKIRFSVPLETLSCRNIEKHDFEPIKGPFEIQIGASSQDIRLKQETEIRPKQYIKYIKTK